jgi:hypothetical protein
MQNIHCRSWKKSGRGPSYGWRRVEGRSWQCIQARRSLSGMQLFRRLPLAASTLPSLMPRPAWLEQALVWRVQRVVEGDALTDLGKDLAARLAQVGGITCGEHGKGAGLSATQCGSHKPQLAAVLFRRLWARCLLCTANMWVRPKQPPNKRGRHGSAGARQLTTASRLLMRHLAVTLAARPTAPIFPKQGEAVAKGHADLGACMYAGCLFLGGTPGCSIPCPLGCGTVRGFAGRTGEQNSPPPPLPTGSSQTARAPAFLQHRMQPTRRAKQGRGMAWGAQLCVCRDTSAARYCCLDGLCLETKRLRQMASKMTCTRLCIIMNLLLLLPSGATSPRRHP